MMAPFSTLLVPLFQKAYQTKSSSREARTRLPFFCVVHFSRGTLPQKRVKGHNLRYHFGVGAPPMLVYFSAKEPPILMHPQKDFLQTPSLFLSHCRAAEVLPWQTVCVREAAVPPNLDKDMPMWPCPFL